MSENKGRISRREFGIGLGLRRPKKAGGPTPPKHKRKRWYSGPPLVTKDGKQFTTTHSSKHG